jgi:hypothetical protein
MDYKKLVIMKAELICMVEKFPGLKEKILSLYDMNNEFQGLCFDYFLCQKSLDQWEANMKKDEKFVQEYLDLKKALESELLQYIEQHDRYVS